MTNEWVSLALPIYPGMDRSKTHGEVRVWSESTAGDDPDGYAMVSHIEFALHVGTHVDAGSHFFPDAPSIEQYPLDRFTGEAVVLDLRREGVVPVETEDLEPYADLVRPGDIVLICYGYGKRFGSGPDYFQHPYLTQSAAEWLVAHGARTVGVDAVSVDLPGVARPPLFSFPAHKTLMREDILVIEGLSDALEQLVGQRGEYVGPPVAVRGADGSPIVPLFRRL